MHSPPAPRPGPATRGAGSSASVDLADGPHLDVVTVAAKPLPELADALPTAFVDRFATVRKYARLLGDFMAARDPLADRIARTGDYEELLDRIPPRRLTALVEGATAVRAELRAEQREAWLDMHTLYPGIPGLLRRHRGRGTSIVTAKDEESVWEILAHHRLESTVVEVIGECSAKRAAVLDLAAGDGLPPEASPPLAAATSALLH